MNPDKTESHDWLCMYAGTLRIQGLRDEEIFYFLLAGLFFVVSHN